MKQKKELKMNENEIATFASKLSQFRHTLKDEERIMFDRIVTMKESDEDVEAHRVVAARGVAARGVAARGVRFSLEGDSYKVHMFKAGDDDDVSAHRRH
jgi:hypothetical protein